MTPDRSQDPLRTVDHLPPVDSVDSLPANSTVDDVRTTPHIPSPLPEAPVIAGYRITEEIARGGMGCVYGGHDLMLDREVAIKTLLPGANAERFVTEAKITARLPHPNIPPVHALGTLPNGTPWLAMKRIHGQTLAALLKARPWPSGDLSRFVQIFEQIAQAVGFAHRRGVIHRDLKPLNVMVGEFGEVQVMDWGLAKYLESHNHPGAETESRDRAGVESTHAGAILGTPGYMSPEQARGEPVDARADVFALGSILAAILTGKPAFVGTTARETIDRSASADLADVLMRLNSCSADAELIALARRCLEAKPENRPGDARVVADEVAAYRAGVEARLRRAETERAEAQVREAEDRKRRRVVLWAGGLIGAVLLAGIVGTSWGLFEALNQTARAEKETERKDQALRAETAALQKAQERGNNLLLGLDTLTADIVGESLSQQREGASPEQKKFLASVLPLYQQLVREMGEDKDTRVRAADAAYRVGLIEHQLGRLEEGVVAFEKALRFYEQLAAENPSVSHYQLCVSSIHGNLGLLLTGLGRPKEAERHYRQGMAIQEKHLAENPKALEFLSALAQGANNLGELLRQQKQSSEAEQLHRRSLKWRQELFKLYPENSRVRSELGESYGSLGLVLKDSGKWQEAEEAYLQAIQVQERLLASHPSKPAYRFHQCKFYYNLAVLYDRKGNRKEAEEFYRKAIEGMEKLAAEFPAVPDYGSVLANCSTGLGILLKSQGRLAEAEQQIRQGLTALTKLASENQTIPDYASDLAMTYGKLGSLLRSQKKEVEAENSFREALKIWEKLNQHHPSQPAFFENLAHTHGNLALSMEGRREMKQAEHHHRETLNIFQKLRTTYPDSLEYRSSLLKAQTNLAMFFALSGQLQEAEREYRQGVATVEKLLLESANEDALFAESAKLHGAIAEFYTKTGKKTQAETHFRKSLADNEKVLARSPEVLEYLLNQASTHSNFGLLLRGMGKRAEAEKQYRQALALEEKLMTDYPKVSEYRGSFARTSCNFGNLLRENDQPTESLTHYNKAQDALAPIFKAKLQTGAEAKVLRNTFWGRALAYQDLGKFTDAVTDWDLAIRLSPPTEQMQLRIFRATARVEAGQVAEAVAEAEELTKTKGWPPAVLVRLACIFATASAKIPENRKAHGDQAMELLQQAIKGGFKDLAGLKGEEHLQSLRDRDDFKKLLADLEAKHGKK
jgi:tetratricopeptide (TPR) repeat protein/tRNA A-37 threonylcarbamoyl transferase component Bud32